MINPEVKITIYKVNQRTSIIDIRDEITALTQNTLLNAYGRASTGETSTIILNFTGLEQINSSGLSLLIILLGQARRRGQRLLTFGLSGHIRDILCLSGLDKVIDIYETEVEAVTAAESILN
jgi:anti-anti-sigma factor